MLISQVLHGATPDYIENELPYGWGLYYCEIGKKMMGIEEKADLKGEIAKLEQAEDSGNSELNIENHLDAENDNSLNG